MTESGQLRRLAPVVRGGLISVAGTAGALAGWPDSEFDLLILFTGLVQPALLSSEETWLVNRLGEDRMSRAYPFKSLMEAGVPLLGGSDSPVELPDPETGITAAVDRHGINPDEARTREQAEALFARPAR